MHLYYKDTQRQFFRLLIIYFCTGQSGSEPVRYTVHGSYSGTDTSRLRNCYDSHNGFNSMHTPTHQQSTATTVMETDAVTTTTEITQTTTSGAVPGWQCCCWNATNQEEEIECRCVGESLTRVPQTLKVPMQRLTITAAPLPRLRSTGLRVYHASLLDVGLTDLKHLEQIEDGAFANLPLLRTIYITNVPKLTYLSKNVFQNISDTISTIRIINSGLKSVPDLMYLPPANILKMIDLDNNQITRIDTKSLKIKTDQLILANNDIRYVDDSAFFGSEIGKLTLKENRNLREVHANAFYGMSMRELDLSSTSLVRLPSVGMQDIETLYIENTHTLKTIPSIYYFKNLGTAKLTHSFHCCAFRFPSRHNPQLHAERMQEMEKWRMKCKKNDANSAWPKTSGMESDEVLNSQKVNKSERQREEGVSMTAGGGGGGGSGTWGGGVFYSHQAHANLAVDEENGNGAWTMFDGDVDYMSDSMMNQELGVFHEQITINPEEGQTDEFCGNFTFAKSDVKCFPMPNDLNPCEDVMGSQLLRISVWIVVALAVIGNVAVLLVILSIRAETASVPRFLMCHLAFADLCLGLYLLLIASIDAHSMGEYFNYAYDWQYGAGCKVAGFLTVFASHLSVFTLTVITIERWLAITHAMYLNKRIKLRPAAAIMVGGWIYAIVISLLPLFGISNYSSTSICLPMEIRDPLDTFYLVAILGLNGVAFLIIAVCYAQIYLSLGRETRHARPNNPGEMSIAKKMALLVFTNFACWAPIAFFGLTALSGSAFINVTQSKILLVFFYPLNSCADPYLYAILTSQYRQDLQTLLSKFGLFRKSAMKYKHSDSMPGTTHFTIHGSINRRSSQGPKYAQGIIPETQFMLKHHEDFV